MQVPEDILQLVEKGEVLSIVGGESDEAVLCSQTRTFSVKRVESSNSGESHRHLSLRQTSILALLTGRVQCTACRLRRGAVAASGSSRWPTTTTR